MINSPLLRINNEELIDMIHHVVYPKMYTYITNKTKNQKFLEITETQFKTNVPHDYDYVSDQQIYNIVKNSNGTITPNAPVTAKEIANHTKIVLWWVRNHIQDVCIRTLEKHITNLIYTADIQNQEWFNSTNIYDELTSHMYPENNPVKEKLNKTVAILVPLYTGLPRNPKKAQNILAGSYTNWLNKETTRAIYGLCATKAKAPAYNMYVQNVDKINEYLHNDRTKNWVFALMAQLSTGYDVPESVHSDITEAINHLMDSVFENNKHYDKQKHIDIFNQLSPKLVKDVYRRYPSAVHTLIEYILKTPDNTIPSYTFCKHILYKQKLLNPKIVAIAAQYSNQVGKTYKTQQQALNAFRLDRDVAGSPPPFPRMEFLEF